MAKNGGGVLYQAVRQLVTDYFRERRDALESEASGEPYAEAPKATMEAYYYLKLMLSAYRDTRPDNADDDGEFSYDDEEYEEEGCVQGILRRVAAGCERDQGLGWRVQTNERDRG